MSAMSNFQNIEGHLKAICLALQVTEAQHIVTDTDARRKQLVKLTIKALEKVLGNKTERGVRMSLESEYIGADPIRDYLSKYGPER
jgi:hypothetical protein